MCRRCVVSFIWWWAPGINQKNSCQGLLWAVVGLSFPCLEMAGRPTRVPDQTPFLLFWLLFFLQCSFIFCSVELTASKRHSLFSTHTRVGQKSCRLLHHFALFIYSSTFTWLPLSSLTAGWKNGWQKSVREQIENKLPSHFLFLSSDAAAGSLHLVSIGFFPRV